MVGSTNPDAAAIADVLAGQRESFGLIVDRYERPLFRVALSRLGDAELAEEAVQEAFLCAYRSLHTYDSRFSFRTWLWTILLNQCRRAYGKAKRTPTTLSMDAVDETNPRELQDDEAETPEAVAVAREKNEVLEGLLRALPDKQSDALRLRFFGGLKFQEIADSTGCSLSTAKNRVRDGLIRLSQHLSSDPQLKHTLKGDSS